ncbi:MAG: class I SAM-dependent methyltransferase [Acidobacteriota bacterium]|nr:class I SAM-dependent methyltransferase [Acidobacteriota bacterium]MDH3522635.1 class I SAM-dependent methyltransferase [Acidobacteriota bacterium]
MGARESDPYRRLSYRRLIAWPERIAREWPFLEGELRRAPAPSVLDLGSGTGEHARHLAARGYRAVGVDRSEEQVAAARDYEDESPPHGPRFLRGDLDALDLLTTERFGAALCLGNVLPHLEDEALAATLRGLARRLLPAGRLVIQLVNYQRIFARGVRHLPLSFRADPAPGGRAEDGEIVFLRLLRPDGERHVRFYPSTLALHPGAEPPLTVESSREVRLRAWRRPEVEAALAAAGFRLAATYGDMEAGPYDAEESMDLVVVATAP